MADENSEPDPVSRKCLMGIALPVWHGLDSKTA
jgi:hypothetical protein